MYIELPRAERPRIDELLSWLNAAEKAAAEEAAAAAAAGDESAIPSPMRAPRSIEEVDRRLNAAARRAKYSKTYGPGDDLEPFYRSVLGEQIAHLIEFLNLRRMLASSKGKSGYWARRGKVFAGFATRILNVMLSRCSFFPQLSETEDTGIGWHARPGREEIEQRLDLAIQEILTLNDRNFLVRFRKCENERCPRGQEWFFAWNEKKHTCSLACSKAVTYDRMKKEMTPAEKKKYKADAKERMRVQRENARKRELEQLKLAGKKR